MTRRIIKLYHAYTFFFSLLFWVPIFYEFQKRMGLSDGEIFAIQSFYYLAFCALELPTGFLADRFGNRRILAWASVTLVVANLLPIGWPTFAGFLLHWLLIATARSLVSGSASAYLYDYLERTGETDWYRQTEGNARALSLFGRVAAWGVVGYLMEWHVTLPYWLTALAATVALLVAARLPEGERSHEPWSFRACFEALRTTPALWLMMGSGLSIFVLARLVQVNLFQPLLAAKDYGVPAFGVIMGITTLFEAAGSAWAEKVAQRFGELPSVFWVAVVMAASTALFPAAGWQLTFVLMSIFALACGVAFPIQRKLLNEAIPKPGLRATLLSVESLLDRAACSLMAAISGAFMASHQMGLLLYLAAGTTLVLTAALLYVYSARKA
ncbi:MAG: MFS transporter [Candidatus Eremiobacteraeota bacterium]|nr:MFS transporter [Candidatus Eremiobacteraeota bacterium]